MKNNILNIGNANENKKNNNNNNNNINMTIVNRLILLNTWKTFPRINSRVGETPQCVCAIIS